MPKQTAAPIDFTTLKRARHYEWREMERGDDQEPFRVKLQHLSVGEANALPANVGVKDTDTLATIGSYVAEWNLTAETDAGDVVPVPVPSAVEDPSGLMVALLTFQELSWILAELKFGAQLKVMREKKASTPSATTPASSNGHDSPTET